MGGAWCVLVLLSFLRVSAIVSTWIIPIEHYFQLRFATLNCRLLIYLLEAPLIDSTCACGLSLQSCLTLCNPMDYSPPGFSVHGILQAGILEWIVMLSSGGSFWPRDQTHVSYASCIGRHVLYHQWRLGSPIFRLPHCIPSWLGLNLSLGLSDSSFPLSQMLESSKGERKEGKINLETCARCQWFQPLT